MFEKTSQAIEKEIIVERELFPVAFAAATLHESVLSDLASGGVQSDIDATIESRVNLDSIMTPLSEKNVVPLDKLHARDLLKSYLRRLGLRVDSQLLFDVTLESEFEIWSPTMQFIGCSHGFMRASSYSFQELAERNWSELFTRDVSIQTQIGEAIGWLMQDPINRRYIANVAPWHFVKETAGQCVSIEIRIKSGGIAYDFNGRPQAIIAVTQLRSPSLA